MSLFQELFTGFLDLLFPPPGHCILCGEPLAIPGEVPCPLCREQAEVLPPCTCGGDRPCPRCVTPGRPYAMVRAAGLYDGVLRECIHHLKYRRETSLLPYLTGLLTECLSTRPLPEVDAVVPVPLHPRKELERGFNQASLLAKGVARHLEKPLATRALVRVRATPPNSGMNRQQREESLAGAFAMGSGLVAGKKVLLVDDIFTTGTTATQCAKVLRQGGATKVAVLTVARVNKMI